MNKLLKTFALSVLFFFPFFGFSQHANSPKSKSPAIKTASSPLIKKKDTNNSPGGGNNLVVSDEGAGGQKAAKSSNREAGKNTTGDTKPAENKTAAPK